MRSLPPWEALRYFDAPIETTFALTANVAQQVCNANPMRVALLLGVPAGVSGSISFSTNPGIVNINSGFSITGTIGYLLLTHHDFGKLVTVPWFAIASIGGQAATALEVNLHDWPQDDPADRDDVNDMLALIYQQIKAMAQQINGMKGNGYALPGGANNGRGRGGSYLDFLRNIASNRPKDR